MAAWLWLTHISVDPFGPLGWLLVALAVYMLFDGPKEQTPGRNSPTTIAKRKEKP